jgi:tetratricopeptide (TPR) repeat protein
MFIRVFILFSFIFAALPAQAQIHDPRALEADPATATGPIAPKLDGLGNYHFKVTTSNPESQYFFDQGYRLTMGFNHSEALRAFKEAARLDPNNAMAYWGWAMTLSPNLNLPMQENVVASAYGAIQKAVSLKDGVTPRERDYIDALATRLSDDPSDDRLALDTAYRKAMGELSEKYPDDVDAATMYAAAIMNESPWNYWYNDGTPKPQTKILLSELNSVIARAPKHPGAHHYLIHAVETFRPELGEASADALGGLMPGAGHLVHMPSHIYMRVGRYEDSYAANVKAAEADDGYITQCRTQGMYPLTYYPHNLHFMVWAAMLQGRSEAALLAAQQVVNEIPADIKDNTWALNETFLNQPVFVMARFGKWDDLLEMENPESDLAFTQGLWHYGRGMAFTHKSNTRQAARELKKLQQQHKKATKDPAYVSGFAAASGLLDIAQEVLSGEISAKKGNYEDAIADLERAVRLEDGLMYNEPSDWYFPVRHTLGAILLDAGLPAEAEVVYWEDLRENPNNGYSLFGLKQALMAQSNTEVAEMIDARLAKAWKDADTELTSSRF